VFCGSGGVEPQSETNWRYSTGFRGNCGAICIVFAHKSAIFKTADWLIGINSTSPYKFSSYVLL
jgi:hypothetical protein